MKNFHTKTIDSVYKELKTSNNGLSQEEAKNRLEKYGENKLKQAKKKSMVARFFSQFKFFEN